MPGLVLGDMTPVEELSQSLSGTSRVIVIAEKDVDLESLSGENNLILMKMVEGSLAAGGRGGGLGERRVAKVEHYHYANGTCEKLFETKDEQQAAEFEVPYYVSRIPLTLRDGSQAMGYGVVEGELTRKLVAKTEKASST